MDLQKKIYVARIINHMEMLILRLNGNIYKSAVSDVVKHIFVDSKPLPELKFIQSDLAHMHEYVFLPREKGEKLKTNYINSVYHKLRDYCENKDNDVESLIILDKLLKNINK